MRWYAAKVHRGREAALREQLAPLAIETYHPEIIVNKQGRRRLEPLFPTYLFCKGDPDEETWIKVR
ncbi:MAG: transcription termination/antitermination NusG family protein, partial [Dehalococcoidia bacterium]